MCNSVVINRIKIRVKMSLYIMVLVEEIFAKILSFWFLFSLKLLFRQQLCEREVGKGSKLHRDQNLRVDRADQDFRGLRGDH
jgi:hypothetical protein